MKKVEEKELFKIKFNIGDWSNDGHGYNEFYIFDSNYPVEKIKNAYIDSCKYVGVQFNHNQKYIETEYQGYNNPYYICTEYEDNSISDAAYLLLLNKGLDAKEYSIEKDEILFDPDSFLNLLIDFIKLSLSDLELIEGSFRKSELITIPDVNDTRQFGYGLFVD